MLLSDFVDLDSVRLDLSPGNKRQLFAQMAAVAGLRLGLDAADLTKALADREQLGSTGFGNGVAIPHGKITGLDRVIGFVARLTPAIDYKAVDNVPVDLVFMLLSPGDSGADHLKALAAISRLVRSKILREKLRGARNKDAFIAMLLDMETKDAA